MGKHGSLLGRFFFGGILAQVVLVFGIRQASEFEITHLLSLEAVATILLPAWLFREQVGARFNCAQK